MVKAIFYKEWIKTRRSVWLAAAVMAGCTAYAFVESGQECRLSGAVQVWYGAIVKDAPLLPAVMQWVPAFVGVLLSLSQFVPEMTDRRLKLTLHLPAGEDALLASLLAYGAVVLVLLYALTCAVLAVGFSAVYPPEIVGNMVLDSLPWFLAGICAYLLTAWICMEPVWRFRIAYGLVGACLCAFFFVDGPAGACLPAIPYLTLFTLLCFFFPFHSAGRFKEGAR